MIKRNQRHKKEAEASLVINQLNTNGKFIVPLLQALVLVFEIL